jgi:hypothetical protein
MKAARGENRRSENAGGLGMDLSGRAGNFLVLIRLHASVTRLNTVKQGRVRRQKQAPGDGGKPSLLWKSRAAALFQAAMLQCNKKYIASQQSWDYMYVKA